MSRTLILPGGESRLTNLHLRDTVTARYIDNDMYDVCRRVQEISDRLRIVELGEGQRHAWVIMEACEDGVDRRVFKVEELDARVLEKLRYLMAKPLTERLAEYERMEGKFEADEIENSHEELYENVGRPMWTMLDKLGFLGSERGVSYPKLGVAAPKRTK